MPKTQPHSGDCQLATRQLTLEAGDWSYSADTLADACMSDGCVLALAVVVPVGSLIVSGSIVVVGNSVNWLEQQGRCDDSVTQRALAGLANYSKAAGGWVVTSSTDLLRWLRLLDEPEPPADSAPQLLPKPLSIEPLPTEQTAPLPAETKIDKDKPMVDK